MIVELGKTLQISYKIFTVETLKKKMKPQINTDGHRFEEVPILVGHPIIGVHLCLSVVNCFLCVSASLR